MTVPPVNPSLPVLASPTPRNQVSEGFERILFEQLAGDMLEPIVEGPYATLVTPMITDAVLGRPR